MKQIVDIEGLILEWSIDGYTPVDKRIKRDEYWCNCGLSVKNKDGSLSYFQEESWILMSSEIDELVSSFEKYLSGELTKPERLRFVESDLSFLFVPSSDRETVYRWGYYNGGIFPSSDFVEMRISLWDTETKQLTASSINLRMNRSETKELQSFLRSVISNA